MPWGNKIYAHKLKEVRVKFTKLNKSTCINSTIIPLNTVYKYFSKITINNTI